MRFTKKPRIIILLLAVALAALAVRQIKRHMIISRRIDQMWLVKFELASFYDGFGGKVFENDELLYLNKCRRHPSIPSLIFEGANVTWRPEENSWRSNIAIDLNGKSYEFIHEGLNTTKSWHDAQNVFYPLSYYCWNEKARDEEATYTNVMTIRGKGSITDLLESGEYSDDDPSLDSMICLVEVADSKTHWGCKGDLDLENLPPNLTQGIDGIGITVLFRDEEIWYLDKSVPLELLKRFMTVDGCKRYSKEELLSKYRLRRRIE